MREIKFRAWDKELNFMINIKRYKIDFNGQVLFDNNDKELYNQTNKIELMQYTGLKDKNDVEIYEGDIIESIWNGRKYQIEWDESYGEWCFCSDTTGQSKYSESIVIGNIYANPELLK